MQAICVLLQVAHHYDQSDTICVLVATAIRIAQCLNMHRLGADATPAPDEWTSEEAALAMQREVKKRVWWFLVRQDWLQIPFQNTCSIHPAQFNTPQPLNCFEDGFPVAQPADVATQSSYTNCLNQGLFIPSTQS